MRQPVTSQATRKEEKMKHFCRTSLAVVVAVVSLASAAWGEVSVNVNVGIPGPRIVLSGPPDFIMPPSLGFYAAVGVPYDLYRVSNIYFLFHDNGWYRGRYYNGPWRAVNHNQLPQSLRRHNHDRIRAIRDEGYRHYRDNRDSYRGKHFKPNKAWKEQQKEEKKMKKEERQDNRGRSQDERRGDREEGKQGRGK
jgi:hypothetical protein